MGSYREEVRKADQEFYGRIIEDLQRAIEEHIIVRLTYTDSKGRETVREVEPYEVVEGGDFFAHCLVRDAVRRFKIPRVAALELTDKHFEPRDFGDDSEDEDRQGSDEEVQDGGPDE